MKFAPPNAANGAITILKYTGERTGEDIEDDVASALVDLMMYCQDQKHDFIDAFNRAASRFNEVATLPVLDLQTPIDLARDVLLQAGTHPGLELASADKQFCRFKVPQGHMLIHTPTCVGVCGQCQRYKPLHRVAFADDSGGGIMMICETCDTR